MRALNSVFSKAADLGVQGFEDTKEISLDLGKATPVSFAGDIMPQEVLTVNEMREDLGKQPIEGLDIIRNGNGNTNKG